MTERWRLHGGSMRPLGPGWEAEVDASEAGKSSLGPGDLVCYLGLQGQAIVHRLHAVEGAWLLVQGDTAGPEPPLPRSAILGRVSALSWRGVRLPLPAQGPAAPLLRRCGLLWAGVAPVIQRAWARNVRKRSNV